jgi:hypothetical protein
MAKKTTKPGPEADRLRLDVDWEAAAETLAKKPVPKGGVPKASPRYMNPKKKKPST